ncbi:MAG: 2-hydroxyacyl-CoA dehydratase family protein, partial [Pseudolysinimonas sp.]
AVMIPQWHRGSEWGRDAARALRDEIAGLVESGAAIAPHERIRLMWVGRGLWVDTSVYQRFQEEFGAVFVWSMYLAIAADGYLRYGDDAIETLAARFVGITDLLYAPPLAPDWYVKEARGHGVDGVVHLVADDVPGASFITLALREDGIPVLEIRASNADPRTLDLAAVERAMVDFISQVPSRA